MCTLDDNLFPYRPFHLEFSPLFNLSSSKYKENKIKNRWYYSGMVAKLSHEGMSETNNKLSMWSVILSGIGLFDQRMWFWAYIRIYTKGDSLVVQQVKNLALSVQWLRFLRWHRLALGTSCAMGMAKNTYIYTHTNNVIWPTTSINAESELERTSIMQFSIFVLKHFVSITNRMPKT